MNVDISTFHISYSMFISCLMAIFCELFGEAKMNISDKRDFYHKNVTLYKVNLPVNTNKTNMTLTAKDIRYGNGTAKNTNKVRVTVTDKMADTGSNQPYEASLPIPIMVASPAVAVGIFIFICIAYKWHTVQLDAQAKELAADMASSGECPSPYIPCSPCHNAQRLLPPNHSTNSISQLHSDSDSLGSRRKGLRTPSPILLVPPGPGNHRGSICSAVSDQEVLNHSPRRHSTFLL